MSTETFFLFWWWRVDGGWGQTFWFSKPLDNDMVYTLGIYVYIYITIVINAEKILVGLIFHQVELFLTIFKITLLG